MDYLSFCQYIVEQIPACLPEEYADYTVRIMQVMEEYNKRDVLKMVPKPGTARMEAAIYLDKAYEVFLNTFNVKHTLKETLNMLLSAIKVNESKGKDHIFMTVVDTAMNRELLSGFPHRAFHSLSIVYRLYVEPKDHPYYSCFITNDMAEYLGMKEEDLYAYAMANTQKLFPPKIQTIGENVYEMIAGSTIDGEIKENMPESLKLDDDMYVVGSAKGYNGAAYLVFNDVIEKIASRAQTDLYLMPATVYDMYVIPAKKERKVNKQELLDESNAEGMREEEKLTNQIYYYDYGEKRLSLYEM